MPPVIFSHVIEHCELHPYARSKTLQNAVDSPRALEMRKENAELCLLKGLGGVHGHGIHDPSKPVKDEVDSETKA